MKWFMIMSFSIIKIDFKNIKLTIKDNAAQVS